MLPAILSAARKYIAEVQSASSFVRDTSRREKMLWDFSDPQSVEQWDCVSDAEMGGQSEASFQGSAKGVVLVLGSHSLIVLYCRPSYSRCSLVVV